MINTKSRNRKLPTLDVQEYYRDHNTANVALEPKIKRLNKFLVEAFLTALLQDQHAGVLKLSNLFTLLEPFITKSFIHITIEKGWVNFDGKMMFNIAKFNSDFAELATQTLFNELTMRKNIVVSRHDKHENAFMVIINKPSRLLNVILDHFKFVVSEESRHQRETHITIKDGSFLIESFDNSQSSELVTIPEFRKFKITEI